MYKKWILLGMLMLMFLAGCQQTPEEDVVVGKNNGELESIIQETNIVETEEEKVIISYSDRFIGADPEVEVVIDADIDTTASNMPVLRVKPHEITVEEVKKWAEVFFEGETAYEYDVQKTKEELELLILDLKQYLGDEEELLNDNQGNTEIVANTKKEIGRQLAIYEAQYKDAPEVKVKKEAEWTFKPYLEYDPYGDVTDESEGLNDTLRIKLVAEVDGINVYLDAKNRTEEDYQLHNIRILTDDAYQSTPLEESEEEVADFVAEKLKAVGLEHWELESCNSFYAPGNPYSGDKVYSKDIYYYTLTYVPVYEGEKVILQQQLRGSANMEAYDSRYYYENLTVRVSNGRIIYLQWDAPLEVVSIENENVKIISYKEALERFQTQMEVEATMSNLVSYEEGYEPKSAEIRIREIELGLARVRIKNSKAEYYLLPVWNFKGEIGADYGDGVIFDSDFLENASDYTIMTINAIDGSIVNVAEGY